MTLRRRFRILVFLCLLAAGPAAAWAAGPDKPATGLPSHTRPIYAPGEVLIQFAPEFRGAVRQAVEQVYGQTLTTRAQAVEAFHARHGTRPVKPGVFGWERVRLPHGSPVRTSLADIHHDPLVQNAEPNYYRYACALSTSYTATAQPDDPHYQDGTCWWFNRTCSDAAFNTSTGFGTGPVTVAVLDTGIDLTHSDLSARLIGGYNAITPSATPDDDYGHGTHVAGLVAADTHNGLGVPGTAYLPGVQLMPVKVLSYLGSGTVADIAEGLVWAADHGARVINMSFGGYGGISGLEASALDYASSFNCVLVAAAGNESANMDLPYVEDALGNILQYGPMYPACYDGVIAVAATDAQDYSTYYSNYGSKIDVSAPGGNRYTIDIGGHLFESDGGVYSTHINNSYAAKMGTSMAAPQVAGAAAMLLLQRDALPPQSVLGVLKRHCENPHDEPVTWVGAGRVNLAEAYAEFPSLTNTPSLSRTRILAYPQPARGSLSLAYAVSGEARILGRLYNLAGERVLEITDRPVAQDGQAVTSIDMHALAPGLYILTLDVEDAADRRVLKKRIAVVR